MIFWLTQGSSEQISTENKRYFVRLEKEALVLPFSIYLEKFTIGSDPGSDRAASYESNVIVKDLHNGVEQKALISMNEPLTYSGYTFYQASYQMQEGQPPISIFAVNRDIGRPVKYAGSMIIVLGILIMFYMNPDYIDIIFMRKKK